MSALVLGANGLIGRFVTAELLRAGRPVTVGLRGSAAPLRSWLAQQGVPADALTDVRADITKPGLGLGDALRDTRDVFNTAGRFAFGLTDADAKLTNVTGALHVVDWAASLPGLRRLIHISGYRVSGQTPNYREQGAYEASKCEADAAVRERSAALGVPFTIANPSTVLGPGQYIGLASMVRDLWRGKLPALPGGPDVFVPVVDATYLARFLIALPEHAETAGHAYWVLDDATPTLPDLIALVADHLGVPAPKRAIPVGVLRALPRAITRADPETLSFLSADRYDTRSARAFTEAIALPMPPVESVVRQWVDGLVAARFGDGPEASGGFVDAAGSSTWLVGERTVPDYVLLHGLPLDADSWTPLAERLDAPVLAADLPGLGRSAARPDDRPWWTDWLESLMRPVTSRPVLVGHSAGCSAAVAYAAAHPDRISGLVLVAPAFLQAPASALLRSPLAAPLLRSRPPAALAATLGIPPNAVADLRRPGAAVRAAAVLRHLHASRADLRALLDRVTVPITLIVGSEDPLVVDRPAIVIKGAGHYPQLTHPDQVAAAIARATHRV